jgi:hypothetical protein
MWFLYRSQAGAAPHPLPGLLQVVPQDFADLLLLVLGQCWQDALSSQGLGMDVPDTTGHRLGPHSYDPGAIGLGQKEAKLEMAQVGGQSLRPLA